MKNNLNYEAILHDISSPLTIIQKNLVLAKKFLEKTNNQEVIYRINDALCGIDYAYSIINESSINSIYDKKINLQLFAKDLFERWNNVLEFNNINLKISISQNIFLKGEKIDLQRVFDNLFKNSFETFCNKPITYKYININFLQNDQYIKIRIIDNAGGCPNKKFLSSKKNHSGLGIKIIKDIILKQFSGTVDILSIQSFGVKFTIIIPI